MYCPRCGRSINSSANFCAGCGLSKREIDESIMSQRGNTPSQAPIVEPFVEKPFPTDVDYRDVVDVIENESIVEEYQPSANLSSQNPIPNLQNQLTDQSYSEPPLSAVDFIFMMVLSAIPFVGLIYLLYLAFGQDDNINKRSYARASLSLLLFSIVVVFVFMFGFLASANLF